MADSGVSPAREAVGTVAAIASAVAGASIGRASTAGRALAQAIEQSAVRCDLVGEAGWQ